MFSHDKYHDSPRSFISSEHACLPSAPNLPSWPPQSLWFLSQCFCPGSSPYIYCSFLVSALPSQNLLFLSSSISIRKVYTITSWDSLSPSSELTYTVPVNSFIYSFTQKCEFYLAGKYMDICNYQPLPCIIVICIPVLSSPISCYLPWVQRMCIFHHMVLFMWWKYVLSGWTSLPLAWQEGSRKGEPRKATCDSVIKQVSDLVWFILFIRFPLNNLKNVPSAVDESWAL